MEIFLAGIEPQAPSPSPKVKNKNKKKILYSKQIIDNALSDNTYVNESIDF